MGNGNRIGNRLNFQVTANYDLSADDLGLWERAFSTASELLWNATEGQLRFGTIHVAEGNAGANNAEFILDADAGGRALATFGRWGEPGQAIQLPAYAQGQVLSILHELGHHLWALDEEYARSESAQIDTDADLPADHDNRVIPLVATDLDEPDGNYAGADALIIFAGQPVETREIASKVGNRITVTSSFSDNPQNDSNGWMTIQWTDSVECTGDRSTGACVMEFSRSNAGTLEPDGTWNPADDPVTEFCTEANHDADADTAQESRYGEACWETIVSSAGFADLGTDAPDPAGAAETAPPPGWVAPTWTVLDPNVRLALVLDRSGSMNRNGGARLAGVKSGAQFWIENAAVEDDQLTVAWYSASPSTQLELTAFGDLSDSEVDAQLDLISGQDATGGTNIVGGLSTALDELTGPDNPASVQAALLITDGAHNTPSGTSMDDVVPDYRAANTNIHTLGVGTGAEMDLEGLAGLAAATGGTSQTAGDGSDANAIQDALIEINAAIRGGMISTTGSGGSDTRDARDRLGGLARVAGRLRPEKRPTLEEITAKYGVLPWEKIVRGPTKAPHRFTWFGIEVEEGARAATFTLSHDRDARYWLYLIDPTGREIHPSDGDVVAWVSSRAPYEFAKIRAPKPGQWTVLGLRLDRGAPAHAKAIAAIDHPAVSVYANAVRRGAGCPVRITAGARHVEPLTGLSVHAVVRPETGSAVRLPLHDDAALGVYTTWADLPDGVYTGRVEIRSPRNPPVANLRHAILHAEHPSEVGEPRVRCAPFVRHVPISFSVGPVKAPPGGIPRDERAAARRPRRPRRRAPGVR